MIKTSLVCAMLCVAGLAMADAPATMPTTAPSTQPAVLMGDASYGIGYQFGKQLSKAGVKFDIENLERGLHDALGNAKSRLTPEEFEKAMISLQAAVEKAAKDADVNFREANAKKKGVTTTASGLQIETITEGTGPSPKATDTVKVHYTGTLIDGTKFDSSVDRGKPATFQVGGVIPGWTEGLQLMKVGGKSRMVIPASIAYGPDGQGPIPPDATLVFEVELISIEKP